MFKAQDYLILSAAFISFLFSVSLWFGVIGPATRLWLGISGVGFWVALSVAALYLDFPSRLFPAPRTRCVRRGSDGVVPVVGLPGRVVARRALQQRTT